MKCGYCKKEFKPSRVGVKTCSRACGDLLREQNKRDNKKVYRKDFINMWLRGKL